VAREAAGVGEANGDTQGEGVAEAGFEALEEAGGEVGGGFDEDFDLVHGVFFLLLDHVFDDVGELADDGLDGAGIDVHATDDDHVIDTAEDAAFEDDASGFFALFHPVASAVAQEGAGGAVEGGEYELAMPAFGHFESGLWIDDLGEVGFLDEDEVTRLAGDLVADGADLGHAVVIIDAGIPQLLDAGADLGDAATGLSGDEDLVHAQGEALDAAGLTDHLTEAQGIRRCAAEGGGAIAGHRFQACLAGKPAAGDDEVVACGGLEGGPEAEEGAEGEGEEDAVATANQICAHEDTPPAGEHGLPTVHGVEPGHGLAAAGAAGLAEACVLLKGAGEIRAEGRVLEAIVQQLGLLGEGHLLDEVLKAVQGGDADAVLAELL